MTRALAGTVQAAVIAAALIATAGCTDGRPAPPLAEPEVVVVDSRIIEGTDLCKVAGTEELEWLLGEHLVSGPGPDPGHPGGCAARFAGTNVRFAGLTSAAGARATVAGNTAFADTGAGAGCEVSVALLPGSSRQAGSYLSISVSRAASGQGEPAQDCRTAGRIADYLLRQLPKN